MQITQQTYETEICKQMLQFCLSRVQAHTGQRHGEQAPTNTNKPGRARRVSARAVLFPRPCLWLRDYLIAVLSEQVTPLRRAALLAGVTQMCCSSVIRLNSYTRIGANTLGGGAEAAAFFQSAAVTS